MLKNLSGGIWSFAHGSEDTASAGRSKSSAGELAGASEPVGADRAQVGAPGSWGRAPVVGQADLTGFSAPMYRPERAIGKSPTH